MQTLFQLDPILPDGFLYIEEFISLAQEEQLLNAINAIHLRPMIFQGFEAKRKVESFGYDYNFDSRKITAGKPIPETISLCTPIPSNVQAFKSQSKYLNKADRWLFKDSIQEFFYKRLI